jgi:hypothetical protein
MRFESKEDPFDPRRLGPPRFISPPDILTVQVTRNLISYFSRLARDLEEIIKSDEDWTLGYVLSP